MNAKPALARSHFLPCFIAAVLSAVISAGLLGAVGGLFYGDGIPFGRVAAVEQTHRDHDSVSEWEIVRRQWAEPIRALIASASCSLLWRMPAGGCRPVVMGPSGTRDTG
jgi:hypothetical protein